MSSAKTLPETVTAKRAARMMLRFMMIFQWKAKVNDVMSCIRSRVLEVAAIAMHWVY
jgi:hypothetical protein